MHVITVAFNQLKGCTWKFGEQQRKGKSKWWEIKVVLGRWDEHLVTTIESKKKNRQSQECMWLITVALMERVHLEVWTATTKRQDLWKMKVV